MALTGWNRETSPYHQGEQELHERLARKALQTRMGMQIHRPYLPDQHRAFFAQLPFLIAGGADEAGWPWAVILFGQPGFVSAPDEKTLCVRATPIPGDPLMAALRVGAPLGFVGMELPTRRRNRLNGVVTNVDGQSIQTSVVQSFGNCPQYIHTRSLEFIRDPDDHTATEAVAFTQLDEAVAAVIRQADTFFVASINPRDDKYDTGGADVNHRGGKPGFIKVEGNTLTIPDYVGNFAFNTFGNFLVNPKAGLLFIDFNSGDLWQLTGTVELLWNKTQELQAFRGAERAWRFHLHHGVRLKNASALRWKMGVSSPNALLTGDWEESARVHAAEEQRRSWRPFRVARVEDESSMIRSFYLEPADGSGLLTYQPGQYLTIRVALEGASPAIRTYTLSSAPSDAQYRISVKREDNGLVSRHLHDHLAVGGLLEVMAPNGSFWLDTQEQRPAVLIAGGVGITPMVSMAREAVADCLRRRHLRPLTIFHAARTTAERGFAKEFQLLRDSTEGMLRYVSLIEQPAEGEEADQHFHLSGRLSPEVLQRFLPLADYDFFLCGPPAFMQAVYDMLRGLGTRDARVFAESFGPASLVRTPDAGALSHRAPAFESVDSAVVGFEKSQLEQGWTQGDGSLLEFAEAHGLAPLFGCRSGACGSCAVRVLSGKTGYTQTPSYQTKDGEVLLCCAVPAKSDDPLKLDL